MTDAASPTQPFQQASAEMFRLLVESVRDYAIFALDERGIVTSWNSGAERIKGYHAREIIGHHFSRFYPEEAIRTGWPMTALEHARREGRFQDEGWRVRKDGSRFWAHVTLTALHGPDGTLVGFAKVTRDMTEAKRSERLEADARQMSEFVAMLAHELRNPLAPIRNAAALARRRPGDTAKVGWALEVIERQTGQLTRLVDDLLDVSRITRGRIRLERRPVALREVVERAAEAVRPICEDKQQVLDLRVEADATVSGDIVRLTQVVGNILNNACKYTPPGGRIEVELGVRDARARIVVRDTGMGIAPDLLPRVFDLFTQEDRSLARSEGGLGLGLAIAQRLAQMHEGSVSAASAGPGCGSEFTVELPLATDLGQQEEYDHSESSTGAGTRVLVVDDNRDSALTMQALFDISGYRTAVAHDGEAAVRTARATMPDVVLLDIGLPGMNGYEVARAIRGIQGLEHALLVAITGYGSEEDRRRALESGFNLHVPKPVDHDVLQRQIAAWLSP